MSLPYSYLQDIVLSQTDDGEMIELHNPGVYFVQIQGRHLLPLYDALNRGCVKSVRPVKGSTEEGDGETHVTAIAAIALAYPEEQIESAYNS